MRENMHTGVLNALTKPKYAVSFLLVAFLAQAFPPVLWDSSTDSETLHILSGYMQLKSNYFGSVVENQPLAKYLSGAHILFTDVKLPPEFFTYKEGSMDSLVEKTVFQLNDPNKIHTLARLPFLLASALIGLYIYLLANRLYGRRAGLLGAFLFAFNATILGYAPYAITDNLALLFFAAIVYHAHVFFVEPTHRNAIITGIVMGLGQSAKITTLQLIPSFALFLAIVWLAARQKRTKYKITGAHMKGALIIGLVGLLVLNAAYLFNGTFVAPFDYEPGGDKIEAGIAARFGHGMLGGLLDAAGNTPLPVPQDYMRGLYLNSAWLRIDPGVTFIAGKLMQGPVSYYYPFAFAIKTQIPLLLLFAASMLLVARKPRANDAILLLPITYMFLFFIFAMPHSTELRYMMPILPLIIVLSTKVATVRVEGDRKLLLYGLLAWYAASALLVFPHHLSYFNEFAGGPGNGYRMLGDSNIDWYQDLKWLKSYMDTNGIETVKLSYSGPVNPKYYGIKFEPLPGQYNPEIPCGPTSGYIAVSANNLQGLYMKDRGCFRWLDAYEPIAQAGYSINIYNIPDQENGSATVAYTRPGITLG